MNRKFIYRSLLAIFLIGIIGVGLFVYYAGVGFGEAAVKTVISVEKAKKNWNEENVDPVDSIQTHIIRTLDSMSAEK